VPQGNDPALVIAVDTSEDALKLALHCGADHAVTADGHQAEHVRDLTSTGADAVFDFVGEDSTITDSVAMLRPGGTYYLVGYGGTVTLPTLQLAGCCRPSCRITPARTWRRP
jgi:NAD+-dependent secondary alcohol dehydrogenase Adh1